jgi:hypothetical protein
LKGINLASIGHSILYGGMLCCIHWLELALLAIPCRLRPSLAAHLSSLFGGMATPEEPIGLRPWFVAPSPMCPIRDEHDKTSVIAAAGTKKVHKKA